MNMVNVTIAPGPYYASSAAGWALFVWHCSPRFRRTPG
jgi:hypothetical protein